MGILNLLKELAPATRDAHLSQFAGQTLGVDAMCWLHRAAFSCPMELARSEIDPASHPHPLGYLRWIHRMLTMCRALQVKLIVVFDGAALPAKRRTNDARDALRAQHRARADALYAAGQRDAAAEAYGRCISVTAAMRRNTQHLLRSQNVPFMVAPFEADAQLGFLYRSGAISAAITSDSDLLAFGCERLLLKLDREGNARLLDLAAVRHGKWDKTQENLMWKMQRILAAHRNLDATTGAASSAAAAAASSSSAAASATPAAAAASSSSSSSSSVTLSVGHSRFLLTCVLSGCDYLPSLHGIGLKKAAALVDEHRLIEPLLYNLKDQRKKLETKWRKDKEKADRTAAAAAVAAALAKGPSLDPADEDEDVALAAASADSSSRMSTAEYILHFFEALLTFQHQLVFDPATKRLVHLTPLPQQLQKLWDEHLASATVQKSKSPSSAQAEKEVIDLDAEDDAAAESKEASPEPSSAAAASSSTSYSAAFPTFRDVTTATARWEASLESEGLIPAESHPLVEGHPLLQLRDFAFLGSILPRRIRDASHSPSSSSSSPAAAAHDLPSIEEWISGRVDTRTFLWHDDESTGFRLTDLNNADSERRVSDGSKQQHPPHFKRHFSAMPAPTPAPAGQAISAFFVRSSSVLPSPSSRVGLFGAPSASTSARKPAGAASSSAAAAAAPTSFRAAPIWRKSPGANAGDELDDLFGPEASSDAAAASAAQEVNETEHSETQRLDELDEDEDIMMAAAAADAAGGEDEGRGLSGTFTPPPATTAAAASVPSPSRNPFVCQPLRAVESVVTFADLSPSPIKSAAAAPASAGALAPSSLLSKLVSSSNVAAAAAAAPPSSSRAPSLSSAFSASGRQPLFTLVKAGPLVMPKFNAAAAATETDEDVCDLTAEVSTASASLKRKQSAPSSSSAAAPAAPRSSSPFKRNKRGASSNSGQKAQSVSSSPLLNFFRKST